MSLIDRMRTKNFRVEPAFPPPAPPAFENMPLEVQEWVKGDTERRQELAYLRSHSAQLENDIKVANESNRLLREELTHVRNERDWLTRHDAKMLATLDDVEALIAARKKSSRAHAYAQPGSGAQEPEHPTAQDQKILEELAASLAPEPEKASA